MDPDIELRDADSNGKQKNSALSVEETTRTANSKGKQKSSAISAEETTGVGSTSTAEPGSDAPGLLSGKVTLKEFSDMVYADSRLVYRKPYPTSTTRDYRSEVFDRLIGVLHRTNVRHTRGQVLKHAVIHSVFEEGDRSKESLERSKLFQALGGASGGLDALREDVAHYSEALRNYKEWLHERSIDGLGIIDDAIHPEKLAALDCGKHHNLWSEKELSNGSRVAYPTNELFYKSDVYKFWAQWKEHQDEKNKFPSRLSMAVFGGAALIAPMLIMTLHPTRLTSLLTTSVFVFAVAVALAWRMKDAGSKDIMGATAAYAAVLVVFVGTSGGATS